MYNKTINKLKPKIINNFNTILKEKAEIKSINKIKIQKSES